MPLSNSPCVSNAVCNEVIASKVSAVTDFGSAKGAKGKVLGAGPGTDMSANMSERSMRYDSWSQGETELVRMRQLVTRVCRYEDRMQARIVAGGY